MVHYDYSEGDPAPEDIASLPVSMPVAQSQTVADATIPDSTRLSHGKPAADGSAGGGMNAMLTVSQAALELPGPDGKPISARRVRALIEAGWLKAVYVNPRLLMIRRKDLRSVMVRQKGRPKK